MEPSMTDRLILKQLRGVAKQAGNEALELKGYQGLGASHKLKLEGFKSALCALLGKLNIKISFIKDPALIHSARQKAASSYVLSSLKGIVSDDAYKSLSNHIQRNTSESLSGSSLLQYIGDTESREEAEMRQQMVADNRANIEKFKAELAFDKAAVRTVADKAAVSTVADKAAVSAVADKAAVSAVAIEVEKSTPVKRSQAENPVESTLVKTDSTSQSQMADNKWSQSIGNELKHYGFAGLVSVTPSEKKAIFSLATRIEQSAIDSGVTPDRAQRLATDQAALIGYHRYAVTADNLLNKAVENQVSFIRGGAQDAATGELAKLALTTQKTILNARPKNGNAEHMDDDALVGVSLKALRQIVQHEAAAKLDAATSQKFVARLKDPDSNVSHAFMQIVSLSLANSDAGKQALATLATPRGEMGVPAYERRFHTSVLNLSNVNNQALDILKHVDVDADTHNDIETKWAFSRITLYKPPPIGETVIADLTQHLSQLAVDESNAGIGIYNQGFVKDVERALEGDEEV